MNANGVEDLQPPENEFEGMDFDEEFLEKLVYEWIRRMVYFSDFGLTNFVIKSVALQFKQVLRLHWFIPTKDWINSFRCFYKILEENTKLMNIGYKTHKSVQIRDIIRAVLKARDSEDLKGPAEGSLDDGELIEITESDCDIDIEDKLPRSVCCAPGSETVRKNPKPSLENLENLEIKTLDDVEDFIPKSVCVGLEKSKDKEKQPDRMDKKAVDAKIKVPSPIRNPPEPKRNKRKRMIKISSQAMKELDKILNTSSCSTTSKRRRMIQNSKVPTHTISKPTTSVTHRKAITTRDEALKYVKKMEVFAMMKENYRLIGLFERLEHLIRGSD